MNLATETARRGDGFQVDRESIQIGLVEALGERSLVIPGERTDRCEQFLARGGEMNLVTAAVGRAASPFDVSLAFEAIQDGDDSAWSHAELFAHRFLAHAGVVAHEAQQTRFGWGDSVAGFFADHGFAVRFASMLQLGSSIPLGIYAATVYARQQRLGIRVPGPGIGLFGGTAAAILLAVSAIITWTQSQPTVSADPELTHALSYVSFAAGGFAHVLGLGLLVAGIAVPTLLLRLLPVPFAWVGLVIAALSELSFLSMVIEPLQFLTPIGRFGSLIWLIVAGFLLPKTRHTQGDRA